MEKIVKYNTYSDDIENGDIVVFTDGTKKTIKKINGHNVIFDDGEKQDLWVIETKVEGIIHRHIPKLPVLVPDYYHESSEEKQEDTKSNHLAKNYKELHRTISLGRLNVSFFHYTEFHNVISMIKSGYIYSRFHGHNIIKFDNAKMIDSTDLMTSTNRSALLKRYVRFYLNPKNEVTYAFHKTYERNNTFGIILSLSFSSIWKSKTHVILTPSNAHFLNDDYFGWKNYDIGNGKEHNIINYDGSEFKYHKTFERYDPAIQNSYITAEVLFYEKIRTDIIDCLYFHSEQDKQRFLKEIDYNKRKSIEEKCSVNPNLFWQ